MQLIVKIKHKKAKTLRRKPPNRQEGPGAFSALSANPKSSPANKIPGDKRPRLWYTAVCRACPPQERNIL